MTNTSEYNDRTESIIYFVLAALCLTLLFGPFLKSCSNSTPDVTRIARMTNTSFNGEPLSASYVNYIVDTPKQKYIPAIKVQTDSLSLSLNNMRALMNDFGVEMGGTKIREYQVFFQQQIDRIIRNAIADSIKLKN